MHDGMPYGRNQGQGHSREVDRQSPTGLIFIYTRLLFVSVLDTASFVDCLFVYVNAIIFVPFPTVRL